MQILIFLFLFFASISSPAEAYIGPGMAGGVIVAILGLLVAIFAGIFGILWFPIKRFLKKQSKKKTNKTKEDN